MRNVSKYMLVLALCQVHITELLVHADTHFSYSFAALSPLV